MRLPANRGGVTGRIDVAEVGSRPARCRVLPAVEAARMRSGMGAGAGLPALQRRAGAKSDDAAVADPPAYCTLNALVETGLPSTRISTW